MIEKQSVLHFSPCLNFLSCFQEKLECYTTDRYFLDGWATLFDLCQRGEFALEQLWSLGSVLFKADSILRGNGLRGIRILEDNGFRIRAVRAVQFSDERVDLLWHYSLGRHSHSRVKLLKRLQALSPSLYLIVEPSNDESHLPCSVRITEFKGQTELTKRHKSTLRYLMGDPQSAFFNFVHTADEPADLVRELGLLFDASQREAITRDIISGSRPNAERVFETLKAGLPRCDLNFSRSIDRLQNRIALMESLSETERADLHKAAGGLNEAGYDSWLQLRNRLSRHGIQVEELDDLTIAGELVELKQEKPTQLFPSCEAHHWANHHPSLNLT